MASTRPEPNVTRLELPPGPAVEIERLDGRSHPQTRVEVRSGARWRVVLDPTGEYEVVASWDEQGTRRHVPEPDWLATALRRVRW